MNKTTKIGALLAGVSFIALTQAGFAETFNIPSGDLDTALEAYTAQSGVPGDDLAASRNKMTVTPA